MQMGRSTQEKALVYPSVKLFNPSSNERDVLLSCRFIGDKSRVLYALSIPEYIEAWLRAPDTAAQKWIFNSTGREQFRIDIYPSDSLQERIHGYCQVINPNQVRYSWTTTSRSGFAKTLVDIETSWNRGWCNITLKHSGLVGAVEIGWYGEMWNQSLLRLCRLLQKN
jgi:hypothetical protein